MTRTTTAGLAMVGGFTILLVVASAAFFFALKLTQIPRRWKMRPPATKRFK